MSSSNDPVDGSAPSTLQDPDRLRALARYDIIDTPHEEAFDHIADLAAHLLGTPMAGIHFIDDACQWAKAQTGMDAETVGLDASFCAHALGTKDLLVVEDATTDPRFEDNPFVAGDPGIRFYAGAALVTPDGYALGRLCVIDTDPRPEGLSDHERETIQKLASVVMHELEYRAQPRHREEVLESITDAFFAVDHEWRFTYVNGHAADLLQRNRTELVGENVWDQFPEAVELEFYDRYHRVMETGEPDEFEAYFPPLETWFSVKAYPLDDGLSVYFEDITAQKEQEEEIHLLSRAVEEAAESIIITGPTIDEPGPRIEYVNPAFERMTGYTAEEVIGKTPRILQGPQTDRAILDVMRSHLQAGEPLDDITTVNYRKDGTPFWIEWNVSPVRGPDGTIEHWVSTQRDVTERRATQEELRRQRNLLNQTQRLAGAWEYDLDTGIVDWSEEVYRIHEVPPGTTIPVEKGIDFYAPEAQPVIRGAVEQAIEERETWDLELPLITAKGNQRWVRSVGAPVVEDGEVVKLAGAFQDVTARHDAQEKLYHSRERLARAQELIELGSWERDFERDAFFWSDETRRIFGWDADKELTYESFMAAVHPEDRPALRHAQERFWAGEGDIDVEYRIRRPDGEERILHERGTADFDDDGTLLRVIGTVLDVTEQRAMEATLRRNEELFRSFAEQAVDVVALFDANGMYKYVSPSITEVTGYARDELIGADAFAPVHPEDLPAVHRAFQEAVSSPGKTTEVEARYQHKNGSWRHLSIRGRRLPTSAGAANAEVEVLANVRDITEQKKYETELVRAKERAEEMSRLKSAFLANMSHEIRTPLTAILGFSDVLRGMIEGDATELLDLIRRSGKRLEDTLTSVLDLAQLESDVMQLEVEPVDVAREVRTAVDLVRSRAKEQGITLRVDVPDAPVKIETDPKALHRILSNLLSNAVKFTDEGHVRTTLRAEDEQVIIAIEDTGVGIASSEIDRIFDEFAQESEGYTRAYEGVGLGLPITKRLTELIGGAITVDSVKGEGSTFTVTLPRHLPHGHPASPDAPPGRALRTASAAQASPAHTSPRSPSSLDASSGEASSGEASSGRASSPEASPSREQVGRASTAEEPDHDSARRSVRVLLVEDNAPTRQMLPLLLEQVDPMYQVDAVTTPSEAIEKAQAISYDLFVLDINLGTPRNGTDLMRELRALPAYRATPMIACTAYAMPGDEETLRDAGFDAYLAKPFNATQLLDALDQALRSPVEQTTEDEQEGH